MNAAAAPLDLTALVISRNEEANLPGLIANLRGLVTEIVIVDDRSDDATRAIAEAAAPFVRFVARPMDPDAGFAGQRNHALSLAATAWVIHMDCDERVSRDLAGEMRATLPGSTLNAYRYTRLNYFLNRPMRHGGWNSWNRPQICRRGAHRVTGRLHEACEIDGGDAATGQMRGLMHHLNDHDFAQRLGKSAQYSAMEADRLLASGRRVRARDLAMRPVLEFGKKYVAKQGFRDGVPGLISALHSATAAFRAHALAWDRQNPADRSAIESRLAASDDDTRQG